MENVNAVPRWYDAPFCAGDDPDKPRKSSDTLVPHYVWDFETTFALLDAPHRTFGTDCPSNLHDVCAGLIRQMERALAYLRNQNPSFLSLERMQERALNVTRKASSYCTTVATLRAYRESVECRAPIPLVSCFEDVDAFEESMKAKDITYTQLGTSCRQVERFSRLTHMLVDRKAELARCKARVKTLTELVAATATTEKRTASFGSEEGGADAVTLEDVESLRALVERMQDELAAAKAAEKTALARARDDAVVRDLMQGEA